MQRSLISNPIIPQTQNFERVTDIPSNALLNLLNPKLLNIQITQIQNRDRRVILEKLVEQINFLSKPVHRLTVLITDV